MWELQEAVVRKSWDTLLNMVVILTPKTILGYVCEYTNDCTVVLVKLVLVELV